MIILFTSLNVVIAIVSVHFFLLRHLVLKLILQEVVIYRNIQGSLSGLLLEKATVNKFLMHLLI
jgi:hypothetical protein